LKEPNELKKKKIISELKNASENCNTIEKFMELSFDFNYEGFTIEPMQNREEFFALLKIISLIRPRTILEIGTAKGGGLFLLGKIAEPNATIISIDLPGGKFGGEHFPSWKETIYESFGSTSQKIKLIRADSHDENTVKEITNLIGNNQIDFLMIDGDHSYDGVKKDFEYYSSLVSEKGIIAFHDINEEYNEGVEVYKYWQKIKPEHESFEIIENQKGLGFGIGIIINPQLKKSPKYTKILKEFLKIKNARIKKLHSNPLSIIISFYNERNDLQRTFPEVKKGDYSRLILWAAGILRDSDSKEKDAKRLFSRFSSWFEKFKMMSDRAEMMSDRAEHSIDLEKLLDKNNISVVNQNLLDEQSTYVKKLEGILDEKNQNVKKLEGILDEKNQNVKKLEGILDEKNQNVKKLEGILDEKNQNVKKLEGILDEKNKLEEFVVPKKNEIVNLNNELINLQTELSNIKNSSIFRIMRKIANFLDRGFPHGSKRGELKKTAKASTSMIMNEGFRSYSSAVKKKIKRREFKVVSPMSLSKDDKKSLLNIVKNNRKNRLKIEPHSSNEIKNDEFRISP